MLIIANRLHIIALVGCMQIVSKIARNIMNSHEEEMVAVDHQGHGAFFNRNLPCE